MQTLVCGSRLSTPIMLHRNIAIPSSLLVKRFINFPFQVDLRLPLGKALANDFEMKLRNLFGRASQEGSGTLNYALLSRNRELEEQREITIVAIPYLGVTGIVLTGFMIVTLVNIPLYTSQHVEVVEFSCWSQFSFSISGSFRCHLTRNGAVDVGRNAVVVGIPVFQHSHRGAVPRDYDRNRRRFLDSGGVEAFFVSLFFVFAVLRRCSQGEAARLWVAFLELLCRLLRLLKPILDAEHKLRADLTDVLA
ncbi:hypothetical protein L596_001906 [Steinernema carpocapsae]|uniref:Uncharacterized protein n=1 Tax=Steinernema carpocapsae TaxID=34508 RepID=A0A4U8UMH1_STECR|nr:hypothetical protein L596_001906 [Steinernema carpocapsae]